ncbi:MAG: hypothetical protein HKN76_11175, partial [Saprospiraceae bacterium]|nr:hypothetical protein [Saprospiraceae bacterium]
MKAFSSLVLFVLCFTGHVGAQQMWINEFHYDNAGADVGEFIEVVVENGTDLTQVTVIRYDGNGSAESPVLNVDMDFTQGDTENGYTVYSVAVGLENDTEGIALTYQGVVVEFISFEGSFMAVDGLAAGYQSTDVGVSEDGATSIGFSLQRTGTGTSGSDFTWTGPVADSPGSLNTSQDLSDPSLTNTLTDTPQAPASEPVTRGDTIKYTIEISNTGNGDANGASIDRKIPLDPNTTLVPGSFKSTPLAYDAVVLNVQEDVAKTITLTGFDLDGDLLTYGITAPPANGSLGAIMPAGPTAGSATVQYTPNMDYFGPDQFEFTVTDDDNNACPAIVKVMVQPVNDPPSITCGPNQTVVNTAGAQSVMGWATGISVGPANESFQLPPTITVANDNNGLFSTQPAVATNGTLTYTPMAGASGLTNVTVTISDGVFADDVSCSFTITVQASPDAKDDALTTIEDTNLAEDLFADNGSGADNLGFPAATIASFGGGSLGGTVTSNAAGSSVALADGTLTVNANGSITLTGQPFTLGTYTFMYRLTNVAGSDDATVTIEVEPLD